MSDWLKQNGISLTIAFVTLVSTYAVYGYRLSAAEARLDRQGNAITALQNSNTDLLVKIGQIQKDIEYIRAAVDKINK